jgi:hypothetical protein
LTTAPAIHALADGLAGGCGLDPLDQLAVAVLQHLDHRSVGLVGKVEERAGAGRSLDAELFAGIDDFITREDDWINPAVVPGVESEGRDYRGCIRSRRVFPHRLKSKLTPSRAGFGDDERAPIVHALDKSNLVLIPVPKKTDNGMVR